MFYDEKAATSPKHYFVGLRAAGCDRVAMRWLLAVLAVNGLDGPPYGDLEGGARGGNASYVLSLAGHIRVRHLGVRVTRVNCLRVNANLRVIDLRVIVFARK